MLHICKTKVKKKRDGGMGIELYIYFCLSVNTKIENGKKSVERLFVCSFLNQIFGNFGAVTNGLFLSIKRFPSAL